jgi:hypothetical protein
MKYSTVVKIIHTDDHQFIELSNSMMFCVPKDDVYFKGQMVTFHYVKDAQYGNWEYQIIKDV